ncbi:AraC family transcriptional regulator [Rufibacter roseus]|uniref:Helix-turn-helix domain-containing protein n=1 Tax=Rufibacter roseus TaxID=1567108 RepID=A0ABW2DJ82_9BACT|nr:helix-turn-helix domain-containing protein [Rufibacter roseus]
MANEFIRFDLYAALLLAGTVQGFFLSFFFLSKKPHRQPYLQVLLSAWSFVLSCALLEIFLCYTGLMFHSLALVDFAEPCNFALGPLTYLLLRSFSGCSWSKRQWWHLAPFAFYFVYHIPFLLQPDTVKYQAYLHAYFPQSSQITQYHTTFNTDPLYLTEWVNELTLAHIALYVALSVLYMRRQRQAFSAYETWAKLLLYFYVAITALFLLVKLVFQEDLGDHFMAVFISAQLFFFTYKLLSGSAFFQPAVPEKALPLVKYEKSSMTQETKNALLTKLKLIETQKFHTQPSASLPTLAKQLHTSPHYLSQLLNECLGKSFFEYLAELRVEEAKAILIQQPNLKVEEVAELSGYLSKSAFTAAFKKTTGQTPGQYRKNEQPLSTTL